MNRAFNVMRERAAADGGAEIIALDEMTTRSNVWNTAYKKG